MSIRSLMPLPFLFVCVCVYVWDTCMMIKWWTHVGAHVDVCACVYRGACHIFTCICMCRWRPEVYRFTTILLFSVTVFYSTWSFGLVRPFDQWALAACLLICPSPSAETADMCLAGFSHAWWGSGLSHPLVPESVLFKDDNQVLRTLTWISVFQAMFQHPSALHFIFWP